jgi:selenium metabolism protein YedF
MSEIIDARGLTCPQPVMRTRDALESGAEEVEVLVDNAAARENVSRFASSRGCQVRVEEEPGSYRIILSGCPEARGKTQPAEVICSDTRNLVVLSTDAIGKDEELGRILMKAFLNTICEGERIPWRLVLLNRAVLLALEDAETREAVANIESAGVEVLVCGTCLDYFNAKERLAAGRVSNMYEIVETMLMASNSVTI